MDPSFRYPQAAPNFAQPSYVQQNMPLQGIGQQQYQPTTMEGMGQNWPQKSTTAPKKSSNLLGIIALVIAIVALVAVIIMSIVWGTMSYSSKNTNTWYLIQGTSTKTTDDFTPEPSELYIVNSVATPLTLNIKKPKTSIEGRIFIVDNTKGESRITVTSSELTAIDNVGNGKIEPNKSAFYLGLSDSSFERLL